MDCPCSATHWNAGRDPIAGRLRFALHDCVIRRWRLKRVLVMRFPRRIGIICSGRGASLVSPSVRLSRLAGPRMLSLLETARVSGPLPSPSRAYGSLRRVQAAEGRNSLPSTTPSGGAWGHCRRSRGRRRGGRGRRRRHDGGDAPSRPRRPTEGPHRQQPAPAAPDEPIITVGHQTMSWTSGVRQLHDHHPDRWPERGDVKGWRHRLCTPTVQPKRDCS